MGKAMTSTRRTSTTLRPPTHPGAILRDDVLPALDLNVSDAARRLGISRQMLHDLLGERRGFSAGMALRVGKLAGNGPGLWLSMQQAYDLWHAERELSRDLANIAPVARAAQTERTARVGVTASTTKFVGVREPRSSYEKAPSKRGAGARRETKYLLRSPKNARRVLDSIGELEAGGGRKRKLVK